MRVDPVEIGSIMHALKRGARDMVIFNDESGKWRALRSLYYMNDVFLDKDWNHVQFKSNSSTGLTTGQTGGKRNLFFRPPEWPEQKPIVNVLAFVFLDNHFHLLLQEIVEGGISDFMKKVSQGITESFNCKNGTKGSLFQGAYKGKVVGDDRYLMWVVPYVLVKNTFEMHPKGYEWAINNFNEAWEWASTYPFSSLGEYAGRRSWPVVNVNPLKKMLGGPKEFKQLCRDMILGREGIGDKFPGEIFTDIQELSFEN